MHQPGGAHGGRGHSGGAIKLLNAGRCVAAHDLLEATATACGFEVLIVSEPNQRRVLGRNGWYCHQDGDAAIKILSKKVGITDVRRRLCGSEYYGWKCLWVLCVFKL